METGGLVLRHFMRLKGYEHASQLGDAARMAWGRIDRWLKGQQRPGRLSGELAGKALGLTRPDWLYWSFRDPATWPAGERTQIAAFVAHAGLEG
jgi:hypothetical protein